MKVHEKILHILRTFGVASSGSLQERLAISRATFLRAVAELGESVVSSGQARRTTYGARRDLRGNSAPIALFRIDESGRAHDVGSIFPLYPQGVVIKFAEPPLWPLNLSMRDGWFEGIPYFMDDMRPQGFLGRQFAASHAAVLQVDPNPQRWSEDDALYALSLLGADLPGNYVLGEPALRALQARPDPVPTGEESLLESYLNLANAAMDGGNAGSSAAGEFPKFTTQRLLNGEPTHVLVKFSGSDTSPGTQRWSDLLVCEHLALKAVASELGITASQSEIHQAGGRTFLEVVRFDRVSNFGRLPVCSWASINAGLVGKGTWVSGAQSMVRMGVLDDESEFQIQCLTLFGRLIANTDMHDGNLSFIPAASGLALAPVYDMLPMEYAPARGVELREVAYKPLPPLPVQREAWGIAARAALSFWHSAASDERISKEFREVCLANAQTLEVAVEEEIPPEERLGESHNW